MAVSTPGAQVSASSGRSPEPLGKRPTLRPGHGEARGSLGHIFVPESKGILKARWGTCREDTRANSEGLSLSKRREA